MSPYWIDGYNLLYAFPDIPIGHFDAKRAALLRFLKEKRPQGRNPAVVVFDSREGGSPRTAQGDLEVVFAAGSADDWIASQLRRAGRRAAAVTVVTNDQGIRGMVRGTGARWMSADDFIRRAAPRHRPAQGEGPLSEKPSNSEALDEVTRELMRRWL